MTLESCPKPIFSDERLERIAKGKLNLPRVEDCSRRAIQRVGRALFEERTRAANCHPADGAEVGRAVDRVKKPYGDRVQAVESFGDELELLLLPNLEYPR